MKDFKNVGIKDIAIMANVSIGTVDRVLHNRGGVAPHTLARVRKVIEETGYQKNVYASRLKLASSRKIRLAALLPEVGPRAKYWQLHINGAKRAIEELQELGVSMDFYKYQFLDPSSFKHAADQILAGRYHGIMMVPFFHLESMEFASILHQRNIPLAIVDSEHPGVNPSFSICQNASEAGAVAAKLLDSMFPQCQHFHIFYTSRDGKINQNALDRAQGFMQYFRNRPEPSPTFQIIHHRLENESAFIEALADQQDEMPCGIFVTNSRSHILADYFASLPIPAPKIVGFDLNEKNVAHLRSGGISFLINQKPEFQSYTSVRTLYHMIAGAPVELHEEVRIPVEIIISENVDFYLKNISYAV